MASEMLNAVINAEKECTLKEAAVKKQAELDKQNAKKQAALLIEDAQKEANNMLKTNEAEMKAQSEHDIAKAIDEAELECKRLSANANKNTVRVIKMAVDMLTNVKS